MATRRVAIVEDAPTKPKSGVRARKPVPPASPSRAELVAPEVARPASQHDELRAVLDFAKRPLMEIIDGYDLKDQVIKKILKDWKAQGDVRRWTAEATLERLCDFCLEEHG